MSEWQDAQIALYEAQVQSIQRACDALHEVGEFIDADIHITIRRLEQEQKHLAEQISLLQGKLVRT